MILDYMKVNHLTQSQTSNHFAAQGYGTRVSQKNISKWKTNEDQIWRKVMEAGGAATQRSQEVRYPEIEAALKLWVEGQEARLEPITGPLIRTKAERLHTAIGLADNAIKFSNGWLEEFKNRHGIAYYVSHGKAGSVNLTNVDDE